jgi:Type ISP C-terminal specificity domain
MPGKGRVAERDFSPAEIKAIEAGAAKLGMTADDVTKLLGERTKDIYLNEIAYWKNVSTGVWEYTIGGYQVIKKWLSYRERDLLLRDMTPEEIQEVSAMARRIAAIILLGPALDANYETVKKSTYKWPA